MLPWIERIESFVDEFRSWEGPQSGVVGGDPLGWPGYAGLLEQARADSGCLESIVTGSGVVPGDGTRAPIALVASAFEFVGGSMGLAAGERMVRAYDRARAERLPMLVLARSGGARLQEGMLALVQMARVADAARRHAGAGLLQVAYLDSPTTGGVYASVASLADLIWAAPGAVIGFAGPRVVELTMRERLAPGAHTAESAAAAGLVDAVLEPEAARAALALLLGAILGANRPERATETAPTRLERADAHAPGDAWTEVGRARAADRPSGRAWLERLVPTRVELRGDRAGGTDEVVVAGLGSLARPRRNGPGVPIAFVATDRRDGNGRPGPAGYRTARRVLALAARLDLPVLTLVDTPGADPSDASERAGVAGEIARTLAALTGHPATTVSVIVGEGGSGGALALAATDRCYLLEGSVFSVIGPEGAAAILERDVTRAPDVAPLLKLTGPDLVDLGVIDALIRSEPTERVATTIEEALASARPGDGRARLDAATTRWLHPR
jgi:acyl-CoA carboxylase subunit beta